ncbi:MULTISPECIES: ABC transporter substrate-binding protein [unclassified Stappia]|uniref:ABC transporter substrate-binding protein n=1 Tax=unclassified Stappia TaxID=2629676 RepID=UPI001AD944C2|nr:MULTISPECIES: ABC transporter substrate-binding protein [unclassified Stappia]
MKSARTPLARALMGAACAIVAFATPAAAEDLVIGLDSESTSIDPHFHNLGPNNQLGFMMFDRLANPDERQNFQPGLAVSWKPVDSTTWEFKLREGVKFHDGTDFNADDVICTFERAPSVPNSPASFDTYIKGKTFIKIDDYTIHVKTAEPYPVMVNDLGNVAIISNEGGCQGTTEEFNSGKAAAGTGPFKFVEYVPGDRIVLAANEDYWGGKPIWDKVTLKPIKSAPSRVAALLAGDVDVINGVPTTDIETLKSRDNVVLSQGVSNRVIYLHLDHFREASPFVKANGGGDIKNPLMDVKVRKALSKAISRELIRDRVMEGQAIPAGQLLPEGFFGVSENLKAEPYDLEGAKALLAEAGLPDGFELTIHAPNNRYLNDAKIAEAIAQMLTRAGIKTQVETMPSSVYFTRASTGADGLPEFSLILVGWGAGSGEASSPLRALIATADKDKGMGSANRGRYSNPEVDRLIEAALSEVDDEKRAGLLAEATEIAIGELAIVPIHYQVNTWATRKGLNYIPRTDEYTVAYGVLKD